MQVVEGIDFTLDGDDEGIHAVDAARSIEVADGFVEFCQSFINLPQLRHHQSYISLRAPALVLFALLLTEYRLLCGPLQIGFEVVLDTAGVNEHVVDVHLFRSVIAHGVVAEQRLADEDGRVLLLLHERLAVNPGTYELAAIVADVAQEQC